MLNLHLTSFMAFGLAVYGGCQRAPTSTPVLSNIIFLVDLVETSRKEGVTPPYFEWHEQRITLPVAIVARTGTFGCEKEGSGKIVVMIGDERLEVHFPKRGDVQILQSGGYLENNLDGFPGITQVGSVQIHLGLDPSQTGPDDPYDVRSRLKAVPLLDLRTAKAK